MIYKYRTVPIDMEARLDGECVKRMGCFFDVRRIPGTVLKLMRCEGVVEGVQTETQTQRENTDAKSKR